MECARRVRADREQNCRYVSFVEIFMQKGVVALVDGGWSEDDGYRYGTMLLFAGMLITGLLDILVHFVSKFAGVNEEIDANRVPEVGGRKSSESSKRVEDLEAGKLPGVDQASSPGTTEEHADEVWARIWHCDQLLSVARVLPCVVTVAGNHTSSGVSEPGNWHHTATSGVEQHPHVPA